MISDVQFVMFRYMSHPVFKVEKITSLDQAQFCLVSFEIPGGITTPAEFAAAVAAIEISLSGNLPLLVNGRGPIWGYGMLFHLAHATPAIAAYDPRLGYVVIQSHDPRFQVGQILTITT
jgi:CRISPR-associated protein Csx3